MAAAAYMESVECTATAELVVLDTRAFAALDLAVHVESATVASSVFLAAMVFQQPIEILAASMFCAQTFHHSCAHSSRSN